MWSIIYVIRILVGFPIYGVATFLFYFGIAIAIVYLANRFLTTVGL